MDQEIEESIKKECNDIVYWTDKEKQAKKAQDEAENRLLDFIEEHYKDQLPTDDKFADIKIGKYEICVANHRNKYNTILYVEEEFKPVTPVTLESATAEDAPSWALAALTSLFPKKEEE
tara:strand:+ start:369 stop:725 length:357 start_codon:yes stop_codon:yes gene_type:complete